MAQEVGYMQNNVVFTEGPFVIVDANGYRIEVEQEGWHCPVLPTLSIYRLMEKLGMVGKTNRGQAAAVCDALNAMVKTGQIEKRGRVYEDNRREHAAVSFKALQATV